MKAHVSAMLTESGLSIAPLVVSLQVPGATEWQADKHG
jgi:hypothetical protein